MARILPTPPSPTELRKLVSLLWKTHECPDCLQHKTCRTNTCANQVLSRQSLFLRYYVALTASSKSETSVKLVITSHADLFKVMETLQATSLLTKTTVKDKLLEGFRVTPQMTVSLEVAMDLALEVMLMVQMPRRTLSPRILESGGNPSRWPDDICLNQFIKSYVSVNDGNSDLQKQGMTNDAFLDNLMARKLVKHCKLKFVPTNNMRDHLRFNGENRTVEIFHHVSFVAELLRMTRSEDTDLAGLLPRAFLLELLDSIQLVLFPLTDTRSNKLLKSLIVDKGFDPACASWEISSSEIRRDDEKNIQFNHFQNRLLALYDELQDPTPKDSWEHWLERRSGKRYALLATLIGVAVAIFLGLAGLAVGILQAYFTYQSWKHPVRG